MVIQIWSTLLLYVVYWQRDCESTVVVMLDSTVTTDGKLNIIMVTMVKIISIMTLVYYNKAT